MDCIGSAGIANGAAAGLVERLHGVWRDVSLDINVILEGDVVLGDGVSIGAGCVLHDCSLAAGTRAVCIPYAGGLESEQTLRCSLLAEKGALEMVPPDAVTAPDVAAAIGRAMARAEAVSTPVDMSGAEKTGMMLMSALNRHRNT